MILILNLTIVSCQWSFNFYHDIINNRLDSTNLDIQYIFDYISYNQLII